MPYLDGEAMEGVTASPRGATTVTGRSAELAAIETFLTREPFEPRVLAFEGDAGIGKTTLWRAATRRARDAGMTVLACRAVSSEASLAFVSLADLLDPVYETAAATLPDPQRRALDVALYRARPGREPQDPRAVGLALVSVLRHVAASSPALVAIDDVQWLDRGSSAALAFAVRRVARSPVLLVLTARAGELDDPLGVGQAFDEDVDRRRLAPLGATALDELLRVRTALPRTVRQRIVGSCAGNPLHALELARAAAGSPAPLTPDDPLPVPRSLLELIEARLDALPQETVEVLLAIASLATPTLDQVAHCLGDGAVRALDAAVVEGLVQLEAGRVTFSHPLFGAAVLRAVAPDRRRATHARLAAVASDEEERARHAALATQGTDERVAELLDVAARRASDRGARAVAGDLQRWAASLTPTDDVDARSERLLTAADHWYRAGELGEARAILESLRSDGARGTLGARALQLLGEISYQEESFTEASALLEEALAAELPTEIALAIHLDLAFVRFSTGDAPGSFDVATSALILAEALGPGPMLAEALAVRTNIAFFLGRGLDRVALSRALEMEDPRRDQQLLLRPSVLACLGDLYEGHHREASVGLRAVMAAAEVRGEEPDFVLSSWLSWTEIARGRYAEAERLADAAIEQATLVGSTTSRAIALVNRGKARAYLGEVAAARHDLDAAHSLLGRAGWWHVQAWARWSSAFLELSLGDHGAALRILEPDVAIAERHGVPEPFAAPFVTDAVEALTVSGELDRAEELLEPFAARATTLERTLALVESHRCRALLAAAGGDLRTAKAEVEVALERAEALDAPFERGRVLLTSGQIERRAKRKRRAREALEDGLEVFGALGADLWAERARTELARLGDHAPTGALTATEQQVAELACRGRTNAEIARQLFVSPKTVEANLGRVYRKLGVRSRTELASVMRHRVT